MKGKILFIVTISSVLFSCLHNYGNTYTPSELPKTLYYDDKNFAIFSIAGEDSNIVEKYHSWRKANQDSSFLRRYPEFGEKVSKIRYYKDKDDFIPISKKPVLIKKRFLKCLLKQEFKVNIGEL